MRFHNLTIILALFLAATLWWLNTWPGSKTKGEGAYAGYIMVVRPGFPFAKYYSAVPADQFEYFNEQDLLEAKPDRLAVWQYGNPLFALIVVLGIPYWYERGLRRRIREREEREAQKPMHY